MIVRAARNVFVLAFAFAVALVCAALPTGASAQTSSATAARLHANAVASFQHGRFPEAYGRFVSLADAGHAPSAELALFMYQHGPQLFGSDWDVSPDQLADWAALTGQPTPVMKARVYPRAVGSVTRTASR